MGSVVSVHDRNFGQSAYVDAEARPNDDPLDGAIDRAEAYLRSLQAEDGHWCGELEGDTILESEYALMLYFLGRSDTARFRQLANYLRGSQCDEGGWANYPGGPPDASVSTKAYFVLKLVGDSVDEAHMIRARQVIRAAGGIDRTNSYTRLLLSIFGVYSWDDAPAVPPEIILFPRWFYFNIYAMSSWSRAIVVPLSIIWAHKPSCPVPAEHRLDELFVAEDERPALPGLSLKKRVGSTFFTVADRGLKAAEDFGLKPFRRIALGRAEAWVEKRLPDSGGLGAIFPSIMNTVVAFVCQGRSVRDPAVTSQLREIEKLEIVNGDEMRIQPCFSPVWDTALAMGALLECGAESSDPALQRGARWLLDKEVRQPGDWSKSVAVEPGGWYFEYANEFYPDCDDTAEVITVLDRVKLNEADDDRVQALERAVNWLSGMQSRNGGWGAFDRDCDRSLLELVPFADHNAMIDPPTVDVSSRCIEALMARGVAVKGKRVERGLAFLYSEQEDDGSWYGRWGSNYLYGTWLVLCALHTAGEDMSSPAVRRAVDWLLSVQHEDGGWGESLLSYTDPTTKGIGPTTAAQTAWAILGLIAAGVADEERGALALERGIDCLLVRAREDGSWYDEHWTATGFPEVFYLRYHLYACYFPLQALAQYRRLLETRQNVDQAS